MQIRLQAMLKLGTMGVHPWFVQEQIDQAFKQEARVAEPEDAQVKARLEKGLALLTLLPTIAEQSAFLASLPKSAQAAACRLYFSLIADAAETPRVVH